MNKQIKIVQIELSEDDFEKYKHLFHSFNHKVYNKYPRESICSCEHKSACYELTREGTQC